MCTNIIKEIETVEVGILRNTLFIACDTRLAIQGTHREIRLIFVDWKQCDWLTFFFCLEPNVFRLILPLNSALKKILTLLKQCHRSAYKISDANLHNGR